MLFLTLKNITVTEMKSCRLSNDHQGDFEIVHRPSICPRDAQGSPAVWQSGGDTWCALLCAHDFRVKNGFSPRLATAPPGAVRDSCAGVNQGEDDRVVAEDFLAPGLENWPFHKGHSVADLPGRGEGGRGLLSLRQGTDVAGEEAHPLCNIGPKSVR